MTLGTASMINRCVGALLASALMAFGVCPVEAEQLTSGTNSRRARQEAIEAVPFSQINQAARDKLTEVLEKPSIYRRLPVTQIECDPDYFVFLVRQPEVVVNIWQLMGITKMTVNRTGPFRMATDDGAGATSEVELIYGTSNLHIYYGEGAYVGPILNRKLTGRCVLILRSEYLPGEDNQSLSRCSMDVFLKVDNATASLVARTLNPIVGSTADHNFVESLHFLERLNDTTRKNGRGVQQMAGRLVNLTPEVRNSFVQMAGVVASRAAAMDATRQRGETGASGATMHESGHIRPGPATPSQYSAVPTAVRGQRGTRFTLSDQAAPAMRDAATTRTTAPYPYPISNQPVIQRTRYHSHNVSGQGQR